LLPHISLAVVEVLLTLNLLATALASPMPVLNVLVDVHGCYGGAGSGLRHQQKSCEGCEPGHCYDMKHFSWNANTLMKLYGGNGGFL